MSEDLKNKDINEVKGVKDGEAKKQPEVKSPATKQEKPAPKKADKDAEGLKIAKMHGVSEVFRNSRGEYFTREDYALLSEKGKKENVTTIKAE